jgi:hypothetical protein
MNDSTSHSTGTNSHPAPVPQDPFERGSTSPPKGSCPAEPRPDSLSMVATCWEGFDAVLGPGPDPILGQQPGGVDLVGSWHRNQHSRRAPTQYSASNLGLFEEIPGLAVVFRPPWVGIRAGQFYPRSSFSAIMVPLPSGLHLRGGRPPPRRGTVDTQARENIPWAKAKIHLSVVV